MSVLFFLVIPLIPRIQSTSVVFFGQWLLTKFTIHLSSANKLMTNQSKAEYIHKIICNIYIYIYGYLVTYVPLTKEISPKEIYFARFTVWEIILQTLVGQTVASYFADLFFSTINQCFLLFICNSWFDLEFCSFSL